MVQAIEEKEALAERVTAEKVARREAERCLAFEARTSRIDAAKQRLTAVI